MNLAEVYMILIEQAPEEDSMKERIWNRIMAALKIYEVIGDTDAHTPHAWDDNQQLN